MSVRLNPRRLIPALATAGLLLISHRTSGLVSLLSLCAALALAACAPALVLTSDWTRLDTRQRRRQLTLVTSWELLILAVLASVTVRGDPHRPTSHRDDNLVPDSYMGHRPIALPRHRLGMNEVPAGFGQDFQMPDPTRSQIVILGDSVLHGWGVAEHETAAHLLAKESNYYQILNASVSGYAIDQYYLYLREILPKLRAHMVLVGIYAGNDYESTGTSNWNGHTKPLFHLNESGALELLEQGQGLVPCVDFVSGSLLFSCLWSLGEVANNILEFICDPPELQEPEHFTVVARLLQAIGQICEEHGARVLFVLLPDRNDFDPHGWYSMNKSKYARLAQCLEASGHPWLEVKPCLANSGLDPMDLYLPNDAAHFSAFGNWVLADCLRQPLGL